MSLITFQIYWLKLDVFRPNMILYAKKIITFMLLYFEYIKLIAEKQCDARLVPHFFVPASPTRSINSILILLMTVLKCINVSQNAKAKW